MVGKEIPFKKEIQLNHFKPNYSKKQEYSNNAIDSNQNIKNRLGNKKLLLNNFEGFK